MDYRCDGLLLVVFYKLDILLFNKVEFQVNKVCLMRKNGRFIRDLCKEKGLTQEQACGTVPNILESCIEMVQGQ